MTLVPFYFFPVKDIISDLCLMNPQDWVLKSFLSPPPNNYQTFFIFPHSECDVKPDVSIMPAVTYWQDVFSLFN